MLEFDNLGQLGEVALHGEHTVDDNQFDSLLRQFLKHALQIVHVVVLIVQLLGKGQTASVDNRSVVTVVADHIIVLAEQCGNHALIHRETR